MPALAASLSWMFQEAPLLDRFALAAAAGFRAVEIQAPYSEPAQKLAEALRESGLSTALINTPVALAAVPGEEQSFRDGMAKAFRYADALGCRQIHCLAGRTDDPQAESTMIGNVAWAADQAAAQGVRLMLEPLNTVDNPGYFLTGSAQARRIIEQLERENVRMQYDCYHMQIMEGRLADTIVAQFDLIGHIQISGVPGRHEPDANQEINYPYLLSLIDDLGFDGWVGCEYRPRAGTLDGLNWARPYGLTSEAAPRTEGSR
jgi:hydroxypyruvate isomerase